MNDNTFKVGTSAMGRTAGSTVESSGPLLSGVGSFFLARVTYVLLDDKNKEKFEKLGGWQSIGAIECVSFINNNEADGEPIIAYPIDTNVTKFPVENELVILIKSVSYKAQNSIQNYDSRTYYTSVLPGYNSTSHNAIPNISKLQTEKVTGQFSDTKNISPLAKAPGDVTIEGRSGNSVRFGSIIKEYKSPFSGEDRSPIILISNNRKESTQIKVPVFENINEDGSTIAMLSPNQSVNFFPASTNFRSYNKSVEPQQKSNYVVPNKPVLQNTEAPLESDNINTTNISDTPPEKKNVKSKESPSNISYQDFDESNLPDNESLEFVKETREYVFVKDLAQYQDAVATGNSYSNTDYSVSLLNFTTLPDYIQNYPGFKKFISSPGVRQKVLSIAQQIGCSENDLYVIMYAESGFETTAQNRTSNTMATGLIQFTKNTAKNLNTSVEALSKMDYLQQLVYVEKYYKSFGKRIKNVYDLYGYTFLPILVGKPLNWVLQFDKVSAEKLSYQNEPIATAAGKKRGEPLTVADFYKYVNKLISQKRKK